MYTNFSVRESKVTGQDKLGMTSVVTGPGKNNTKEMWLFLHMNPYTSNHRQKRTKKKNSTHNQSEN